VLSLVLAAVAFVTQSGTHLELGGKPYRFGGANVEWLGLIGYGPADPRGPRYPTHYEIDDALATAQELGARVVRSQTMGDSVGCDLCIQPRLGVFNERAFEPIDYALASARKRGLRLIPTIIGDDARAGGSGCVYLRWRGIDVPNCSLVNMAPFWTDPTVRGDVKRNITALLNHVNRYTGVAYKDDPAIFGWDLLNGGDSPREWTREIVAHVRTLDRRHLVLSSAWNALIPGVNVCVAFVYPHWRMPWASLRDQLQACRSARKPFVAYEYGWDRTNYRTVGAFRGFLETLRKNRFVSGDAFWALQAHRRGHGWMPIPAPTSDRAAAARIETGHWWALYYTGLRTLVNTAADMAVRAQVIRTHNFAMSRTRVPPHRLPPRPTITSIRAGRLYWQGSAGAKDYSIQRFQGRWRTVCNRCVTDASNGYRITQPGSYRVIPYNLDGKPGPASRPSAGPRLRVGARGDLRRRPRGRPDAAAATGSRARRPARTSASCGT
jgi:mannan endo-1,4-beta-mannosidase